MWDFFKSDVGKVALGGLIAVGGQLAVTLVAWGKEVWFDKSKKRKDAEYLAMRLVLLFDELISGCHKAVHDPLAEDREGVSESTVPYPSFTLPEGDYKALPRRLMYEVVSMPNRVNDIHEGLACAWEFSGPPNFDEFFLYRQEHWSKLGLKALDLIDALCRRYEIPAPQRPKFYSPRTSFQDLLAEIELDRQREQERTTHSVASLQSSHEKATETKEPD
jgi:hypothetical protein